jgi:hypothetical protein
MVVTGDTLADAIVAQSPTSSAASGSADARRRRATDVWLRVCTIGHGAGRRRVAWIVQSD